tara:strand:+ start:661 stop:2529 length:1869 start_codon:yes stop_codon:yes gene_type:complete
MGKRPPSPPPPPDYTQEKRDLRLATEADYQQKADAYNQSVANYNQSLSGFSSNIGDTSSTIGGLSMRDLYDDPTTTDVNENQYGGLSSALTGYRNQLAGLNAPTRPMFDSVIQSEYGPISISNIPTLNDMNTNMYNNLNSQVGSLTSTLNDLKQSRTAEEGRVNTFRNQLLGDAAQYSTGLGQLGIADLNQMNELERNLGALDSRRSGFTSQILDQMYPSGFGEFQTRRAGLTSGLQDLRDRRQTELDRISGFESGLLTDVDAYRDRLGGLSIADADAITALQDDIASRQRQAGRFSSELGFDFADELGELYDVNRGVTNLSRDRQTELDRISSTEQQMLANARAAEAAAEGGNIYSAAGIDAISDRVRDVRGDISGFSSVLPFDFSGADDPLSDADTALADLTSRRATALDEILSGISGATTGMTDAELYDEAAINSARSALQNSQGSLAPFSGGRVGDIQSQITAGLSQVDSRMAELDAARAEIETRAQALMEQINNASYYEADDLTGNMASAEALQSEVDLYAAQNALDEITTAMNRLQSEKQRLEVDAENVAAREAQGRQDILSTVGASGVPEFQNYATSSPMTIEQYMALLASGEDAETITGRSPTAFSRNMGVIRV